MQTLTEQKLPAAHKTTEGTSTGALEEGQAEVLRVAVRAHVIAMAGLERVHDERGVTLAIIIALLIPVGLLGALFMDVGRLYVTRGRMQVAADAAALAGASGFIDGDVKGDSVEARATHYLEVNPIDGVPAILESLSMNPDSGTLSLVLKHQTGPLLLAPDGLIVRIGAKAKATLAVAGEVGRPIPNGNAFGWWKNDKNNGAVTDSGLVRLGS